MENVQNLVHDKWTQFTKDLVDSTDKVDTTYPISFNPETGRITLIELTPKNTENVELKFGKKEDGDEFCLSMTLQTLEWEEIGPGGVKKKRTIKVPRFPNMSLPETCEAAVKMCEAWEGFRKLMVLTIMTHPSIAKLNLPGTGMMLADQLGNKDGVAKGMDNIIKKAYNADPNTVNMAIRNYESDKFATVVKDKMIAKSNSNFIEFMKFMAEVTKSVTTGAAVVEFQGTGVQPSLVKQTEDQIKPIVSASPNNLNRPDKPIGSFV